MKITRHRVLPLAALALILAACGSTAEAGGEVRPFSEVQDSEFVFENDPTFPTAGSSVSSPPRP